MVYRQNIVIVGMSTNFNVETARVLADNFQLHFMDANRFLEYNITYKIRQIVEDHGVDFFLKCENKTYKEMSNFTNSIIGSSMSSLINTDNIEYLRKSCYVVLLRASELITKRRFAKDNDNYIKDFIIEKYDSNIFKIYSEVESLCDIVINTNNLTPVKVAHKIEDELAKLIMVSEAENK